MSKSKTIAAFAAGTLATITVALFKPPHAAEISSEDAVCHYNQETQSAEIISSRTGDILVEATGAFDSLNANGLAIQSFRMSNQLDLINPMLRIVDGKCVIERSIPFETMAFETLDT